MAILIPYRRMTINTTLSSEEISTAISDSLRPMPAKWLFVFYPRVFSAGKIEYIGSVTENSFRIQRLITPQPRRGRIISIPIISGNFYPLRNRENQIEVTVKLPVIDGFFILMLLGLLSWLLYIASKSLIIDIGSGIGTPLAILAILLLAYVLMMYSFNDEANQAILFIQSAISLAEKK